MNQALSLPCSASTLPVALLDDNAGERPDGWTRRPADALREARFAIHAEAEADVLCKLLNLFALQGWLLAEVHARQEGEWLQVSLRVPGMPVQRAEVMAARMRSLVSVAAVELDFGAI
ncbi:hypothetical protein [Pseudomonas citronellolis]|uniref:hypothetical protein n=1 Tax=Pseudomonas citronellolis TaxID=53408 RepID=UPI0023E43FCC|nr:hypothetical protein [Pseudomonas citronellolis]MDF3936184.1 hypothetical protein [Pseudomonas citronellolis]